MFQKIKKLFRQKNAVDFITVADVAAARRCDVRTVYNLIGRGVLPPLVGDQKGMAARDKGWERGYWLGWFQEQIYRNNSVEAVRGAGKVARQPVNIS